nr:hypothetical protein [Streptomyces sabulosicollis]
MRSRRRLLGGESQPGGSGMHTDGAHMMGDDVVEVPGDGAAVLGDGIREILPGHLPLPDGPLFQFGGVRARAVV